MATCADDGILIQEVRTRHRAAIESILTFYCKHKVSIEYNDGRKELTPIYEYWRLGDRVRGRWRLQDQSYDLLIDDLRITSVRQSVNARTVSIVKLRAAASAPAFGVAEPWYNALFLFYGQPSDEDQLPMTFESLADKYGVKKVERVHENQTRYVVAELAIGASRRTFWFNESKNFLIGKIVATAGDSTSIDEVDSFDEVVPGVFFPAGVTYSAYVAGQVRQTRKAIYSDVRINQPIPPDVFRLPYPPNAQLHDLIQGKKFVTDAAGRVSGAGEDLGLPPPPQYYDRPMTPMTETKAEPTAWISWVFPISLLTVTIAGGIWTFRKLRHRFA